MTFSKSCYFQINGLTENFSCTQAVCRRTAKEEIEFFKSNVLTNINYQTRIITKILWEINKDGFNTIDRFEYKTITIAKETVNSLSG